MTTHDNVTALHTTPYAVSKVLIVDDLADARWVLSNLMRQLGLVTVEAVNGESALRCIQESSPHLVLLDVGLPDMNGFDVLARIHELDKNMPVILITGQGNMQDAVRAIRCGAFDYISKPFSNDVVALTVRNALAEQEAKRQVRQIRHKSLLPHSLVDKMGRSDAVLTIQTEVNRVSITNFSVLVTGESGTGKELVSHAIHASSSRSGQTFVALDCGSIPDTLIESELFGHEKGAFTGAYQSKAGAFELAAGGTIFLDEIGNLPWSVQGKLLRVLETRRIHKIGSSKELAVDFRVVAATNADLLVMVEKKTFRGDLYHRLAEYTINVPALRERKEDLVFLVEGFLTQTNKELGRQVQGLNGAAWSLIHEYSWPGNVRELRNQLRRAVLMCDETDGMISPKYLGLIGGRCASEKRPAVGAHQAEFLEISAGDWATQALGSASALLMSAVNHLAAGADLPLKDLIERVSAPVERSILLQVLVQTQYNKAKASRILHVDYKTLHKKLKEHAITTAQFMK